MNQAPGDSRADGVIGPESFGRQSVGIPIGVKKTKGPLPKQRAFTSWSG